jgi:hypothetical protein
MLGRGRVGGVGRVVTHPNPGGVTFTAEKLTGGDGEGGDGAASVSAGTADGSRAAVSSNLPAKVAVATLPAVKQRGGNKAGVGVIPKNKAVSDALELAG